MTDLEERLASPTGDAVRAEIQAGLEALAWRLRTALASGVPRHEFADWDAAIRAVESAGDVLRECRQ